jgi:hypothetical protein
MRFSANAWSRRRVLFGGTCMVLVSLSPADESRASEACVDPDELSDGEQSMRESLAYTDTAADASKVCGGCDYFSASGPAGCGQCLILHGAVSAGGHCDSWTEKSQERGG